MMSRMIVLSALVLMGGMGWVSGEIDRKITEEDIQNSPYYGMLDADDIRQLLCHSSRHQTQPAFEFQEGCKNCIKKGNQSHPMVWLLTMIPEKESCRSWENFPPPSQGDYLAAHYVCLFEECGQRFTPAKWTSMDVHCRLRPQLPCEMTTATLADTFLRPERFIKEMRYELMEYFWALDL